MWLGKTLTELNHATKLGKHYFTTFSDTGWIGWKRRGSDPVDILFNLNAAKVVSAVSVVASNRVGLDIMVSEEIKFVLCFS